MSINTHKLFYLLIAMKPLRFASFTELRTKINTLKIDLLDIFYENLNPNKLFIGLKLHRG